MLKKSLLTPIRALKELGKDSRRTKFKERIRGIHHQY